MKNDTNTIYSYSTETYLKYRGWSKVGHTQQLAADRVAQQDSTSNPEPLIILKTWEVPSWLSDRMVHAELEKMGKIRVREDKDREWFECSVEDVDSAINGLIFGVRRPNSFPMRDEQKECHDKVVAHFKSKGEKFLMNAKMRFGKTFTSYQIIKTLKFKRNLVITYKPAVDASWREDMESHVAFEGWNYYNAKDFDSSNPIKLPSKGTNILFTSFQDFNDFEKAKWSIAKDYDYDLVIIDEMHYGTNTERAQESLEQINRKHTLYASGTPLKALMSGQFLDEEIFTWDYADEQAKRKAEKDAGWQTEVYRWLPVMSFYTFEVSEEAKKLTHCYSTEEGFTMTKMFGSNDGESFIDDSAVKLFVDQVFGIGVKKTHSPVRTHAVDHMLFVMPPSVNSATAMSKMLEKRVGNDYRIINVSGDNVTKLEEVRNQIRRNSKTITVTCGRFNTGVTVPEWDMILMLDDTRAPETYFQTVFRCQSPDPKRRKEACYVIDFNPQRCLEMIYEFADIAASNGQSTQEAIKEFLEFAPVLDHSGNRPQEVSLDQILNMMAKTGGYAERFGSSLMLNWSLGSDVQDKFYAIKAEKNAKISSVIADNDLVKGKNFESKNSASDRQPTAQDLQAQREFRQRVITMMRSIPTYLFCEENKIDNVDDILYNNNQELFFETVGITLEDFKELCPGFIRKDRLDRAIMAFNQIRHIPYDQS